MATPSIEPLERSRLLPPISFRAVFAVTTSGAVLFAIAAAAGRGGPFAVAIVWGMIFVAICFVLFSLLFLVAWSVAVLSIRDRDAGPPTSPFAEDRLPPQWLPPREPPL